LIAKDKALVVDIDGTLCPIKGPNESYRDLPVDEAMKARLQELRAQGWRIILSSSRGMRTYDGNAGEILKNVLPVLSDWLARNDVPFDEIWMAKPWPGRDGFYVDDRTVRPREFLTHSLEELEAICDRDRVAGNPV
jgi:capsule biosynthesis phosphatase